MKTINGESILGEGNIEVAAENEHLKTDEVSVTLQYGDSQVNLLNSDIYIDTGNLISIYANGYMNIGAQNWISFGASKIDFGNARLEQVGDPIDSTDAANKAYVDAPKSHIVLTDSVTNKNYKLSIADGKLTMEVVE